MTIEPMDILMKAALSRLSPLREELRTAGWDADLMVYADDTGHRRVCIEVHLRMLVPVEVGQTP